MRDLPRLTRAELALLDRLASEECGLPGAVLMENAGRGAAGHVLALLQGRTSRRVAVLAGGGNNGGDACVLARHLAVAGVLVELFASRRAESLKGDAATMRRAAERIGVPVHDVSGEAGFQRPRSLSLSGLEAASVVVDGLLGTGFRGEVRADVARLIEAVNACAHRATIVALDLPSGLDADSGAPSRPTVVAHVTVTFAALKTGFDAPAAQPYLGRVVLATIGVPADLAQRLSRRTRSPG